MDRAVRGLDVPYASVASVHSLLGFRLRWFASSCFALVALVRSAADSDSGLVLLRRSLPRTALPVSPTLFLLVAFFSRLAICAVCLRNVHSAESARILCIHVGGPSAAATGDHPVPTLLAQVQFVVHQALLAR